MATIRRQTIYLSVIAFIVIVAFFFHVRVFADTLLSNSYMEDITALLYENSLDKGGKDPVTQIIKSYCSAVFDKPFFNQNDFFYNAKQSAFVYLLCTSVDIDESSLDAEYFARTTFKQLGLGELSQETSSIDYCTPMSSDCDLSTQLPKLLNGIITDYVNMKQTNIYGLIGNFETDQDIETQINIFSKAYFGLEICNKDERNYASTCRAMKSYFKNARTLLDDVTIFAFSGILSEVLPIAQQNSIHHWEEYKQQLDDLSSKRCLRNVSNQSEYDIFLCGLYGDTATSLVSFANLLYNEMFYYRLFMGYYLLSLQQNPWILAENTVTTNYSVITKNFTSQYNRSQEALSLTLRMMRDAYMTYPLHIGFLMYQEDLDGFGKLLAKIATPIYTLYDKLRNVQTPQ